MSWPVLVFDIESIPDVAGLRLLRGSAPDSPDAQVFEGWCQERKEMGQGDFMPLHLCHLALFVCVAACITQSQRAFDVAYFWGLGGTLQTGRVLDYSEKGDENRKLCSLYLSLMDRMGTKLDRFGDSNVRLDGI